MPAIQPRPSRPSFYPDWSTLIDAFDGLKLDAPSESEKKDLCELVYQIARNANLCLSFAHLMELLRGKEADDREQRAACIDNLDVVWLLDLDQARKEELKRVLRRAAKRPVMPLQLPAGAPSFLSQFKLKPAQLADVLLRGSVSAFVNAVEDDLRENIDRFAALGPPYNQQLFQDRKSAAEKNVSEDEFRRVLNSKTDKVLLEEALELNNQMAKEDQDYRVKVGSLWVAPDEEFVKSALRPYQELLDDVPTAFVSAQLFRGVGAITSRKAHVNSKFFISSDRESDPFDWWHVIGATYCDVFICDRHTSECLGNTRQLLNRPKEIVYRGDMTEFVQQIRGSIERIVGTKDEMNRPEP